MGSTNADPISMLENQNECDTLPSSIVDEPISTDDQYLNTLVSIMKIINFHNEIVSW